MKTKIEALLEILVVLCPMLLVATLPAITTASEDDFTLGIYGNANMDDTIDMRDTTYIKLAIFGKKPKTDLADANYDGKVSMLDVGQAKLIILGKEKELTILDDAERSITLKMPLERVVLARMGCEEALVAIGAVDRVVGVTSGIKKYRPYVSEAGGLMDLPSVGYIYTELDYEKIVELNPDLVYMCPLFVEEVDEKIPDEISVVALEVEDADIKIVTKGFKTLGVIFGKEKEANEVIDWIQKYDRIVKDRTKDLNPEEKPTFYIETYDDWVTYGSDNWDGKVAAECGGRNIIDRVDLFIPGENREYVISPEWLLEQNPDVIFRRVYAQSNLVTEEEAEERLEKLVDRPGWANVNAVKNSQVYLYNSRIIFTPANVVGSCYFAKCLQPDLFSDLNPMEIFDEYWNTFIGIDFPEMPVYPEPN
jgi:iron complex transport system substrate-binding protein